MGKEFYGNWWYETADNNIGGNIMNIKERIENDKLYILLLEIKEKPELILVYRNVKLLYLFISGYYECEYRNSLEREIDIFNINNDGGFDMFVHKQFRDNSTHNWASIISFYYPTYGKDLDKFYELFSKYIEYSIKKYELQ